MDHSYKKDNLPEPLQKEYVQNIANAKSLLQKELDINQAEQKLLRQRIAIMSEFVQDLPSSDPQYSMIYIQLKMDQIEIDELSDRETTLIERLEKSGS